MTGLWRYINIHVKELNLETVLPSGQSFKWKQTNDEWIAVMRDKLIILRQESERIGYRCIRSDTEEESEPYSPDTEEMLHDYFNSSIKLSELYADISERDEVFAKVVPLHPGIRILRQDPWETLISFICSSNNNIKRIMGMIDSLCTSYGSYIASYQNTGYYTFPRPIDLCHPSTVKRLRDLGFGYRAPYIHQTALKVQGWQDSGHSLEELRGRPYEEVRKFLLQFHGVGPKVADCVALMGFDCHCSVPIDTHIWNIVQKKYAMKSKIKLPKSNALSRNTYDAMSNYLRGLWGEYAGWAQAVIFISELKK
ncbi:DNA glycosylase [Dipodascopsis uninucleata]